MRYGRPMRLLVISARYPTVDRPAAGAFVRDRLKDPELKSLVVAPGHYGGSTWIRYAGLLWRGLTARGHFDGVEGHFVVPSGFIALVVARMRRLPLVVYAHGGDVREMAHRNRLMRWAARRAIRGADEVVANSPETAALVARLGSEAVVVAPGIDLDRFPPQDRPAAKRVLYLGGDVPHKGIDVARGLADTLVGPGIREVDPAEIPALMSSHSVVLVPSLAEPFGLAAAEAIASGRWVVARAVGGLPDIVSEGVNGTLVSDGDFAGALASVPDYDPATVSASARRFSIDEHRQRMAEIWEAVLQRRGTTAG